MNINISDCCGIPDFECFKRIEPLQRGLSGDDKYIVETVVGRKLLRIADKDEFDRKKIEFNMMQHAAALGIPMSVPLEFGVCGDGKRVYTLLSWCEGMDAEVLLPSLTDTEQTALGEKAGALLRKIHTLPAPEEALPWNLRFGQKIDARIAGYRHRCARYKNGERFVRYLTKYRFLLETRPQTFNHGDYNTSNIIVMPDGEVGLVDFNSYNGGYGDPWWEFCAVAWGQEINARYHAGLYRGYFGGTPPPEFFRMLSYYFAYDALAALCDAGTEEGGEPEDGIWHAENVLRWFDRFQNPIPVWCR